MLLSRLMSHQGYDVPFFLFFSTNYAGLGPNRGLSNGYLLTI